MSNTSKRSAGKTALALLFSSTVAVTGVTAIVPAVSAQTADTQQDASETATKTYADGASVTYPTSVAPGGVLHLEGENFFTIDRSQGSLIAVKLDDGGVSRKVAVPGQGNKTIWQLIDVDSTGKFSVDVPLPTTEDSDIDEGAFGAGTGHNFVFLTGSLRPGDNIRGGAAGLFTIEESEPTEPSEPPVTTTVTTTVTETVTSAVPTTVTSTVPTTVSTTVPTTVPTTVTSTVHDGAPSTVTETSTATVTSTVPTTVSTTIDRPTTKTSTVTTTVDNGDGGTGSSGNADAFGSLAIGGLGGLALGGLLVGALAQAVSTGAVVLPEPFAGIVRQFLGQPAAPSAVPVN